jgi:hypothetical protein
MTNQTLSISCRFAELAMKVWRRDRTVFEELRRLLPRPETLEESEDGIVGRGPNGMAVGLPYGLEPTNALVQIGFLYAGELWPFLPFFHEANKIARKIWREAVRNESKESTVKVSEGVVMARGT